MKSPLARGRLNSEQEMIEENWSEISQWDLGIFNRNETPYRFILKLILFLT